MQTKNLAIYDADELNEKLYKLKLEQDLLAALERKNLNNVFEAIANGADVNTSTEQGHTPLMLAVLEGDQEVVQDFVNIGARVKDKGTFTFEDEPEARQMNALELAQKLKHQPIVRILAKV